MLQFFVREHRDCSGWAVQDGFGCSDGVAPPGESETRDQRLTGIDWGSEPCSSDDGTIEVGLRHAAQGRSVPKLKTAPRAEVTQ